MIPKKMRIALTGAAVLATALVLSSAPLASAAPVAPPVTGVTQSPQVKQLSPAQAEKYWTPERMRNARPVIQDVEESPAAPKDASPILTPGGDRFGNAQVARPYTANFNPRVTGKIFFTNPRDGLPYVCSGAVMNSSGKSVVSTAAHCVFQGGPNEQLWSQNLIFVPSYDNGAEPLFRWTAATFWIPTSYFNHGNDELVHEDDIASVAIHQLNGQRITNVVGGLGWAPNNTGVLNGFASHGYPRELYGGENQLWCLGNGRDTGGLNGVTYLFTNNCVSFGGWSGGPVINGSNQLLAVTSGGDRFTNTFYARAATNTWIPVLDAAQAAGY
jgi:V8-like Glu-specific endopeptidase